MLVSWLIPYFQTKKEWLEEALFSCSKYVGGISDQEILVYLDGPASAEIHGLLEKYNVTVYSHRYNRGVEYALNALIDNSHGEYLARLDADDFNEPRRIEKQLELIHNNGYDAVGSWLQTIPGRGVMTTPPFTQQSDIRGILECRGVPIYHPSCLFRASSLKQIEGYPIGYRRAEDFALWIKCFNHDWKIANITEPLVNYRIHDQNTCREYGEQQYTAQKAALRSWRILI